MIMQARSLWTPSTPSNTIQLESDWGAPIYIWKFIPALSNRAWYSASVSELWHTSSKPHQSSSGQAKMNGPYMQGGTEVWGPIIIPASIKSLALSLAHFIRVQQPRNRQHRDQHYLPLAPPAVHTSMPLFATFRLLRRNRCLLGVARRKCSNGVTKSAHFTMLSEMPRLCCSCPIRATSLGATAGWSKRFADLRQLKGQVVRIRTQQKTWYHARMSRHGWNMSVPRPLSCLSTL
ncbi:hypothetical protein EDB84DRAFT_1008837 [Lactarius hengduanensis]|nr:hypothetical protein EDB84DRAFT_1008837 [Lactarius hengduanensis]